MPGWPRHLVCIALAAHAGMIAGCSADPGSNPAFLDGDCGAGQRDYEGFCLPEVGGSPSKTNPIMGHGGQGSPGSMRDAGGSTTSPQDASTSEPQDANASMPGADPDTGPGTAGDSGMQTDPECQPEAETCNDRDDDCDGRSDELIELGCYEAPSGCAPDGSGAHDCRGLCRAGVQRCSAGELGACEGQVLPAAEELCTTGELAADENCDGTIDEGCSCNGQTQACYSGDPDTRNVSPCRPGMQTCGPGGFGACEGEVVPVAETCANAGEDDDCDGEPDDVPMLGSLCTEAANEGLCASGTRQCAGGVLACATPSPVPETCDRRDQDCDGHTDEDFDLQTDTRHCGMCGRACGAGQDCCGGGCITLATSTSHCGACGMPCAAGQTCCSGACRDLQNDPTSCGTCGRACAAGQTCCGGNCVDTQLSTDHCGTCGNDCGDGSCCGGACFNLNTAQDHCGSCGNGCAALLEGCCRGTCRLLMLGC